MFKCHKATCEARLTATVFKAKCRRNTWWWQSAYIIYIRSVLAQLFDRIRIRYSAHYSDRI